MPRWIAGASGMNHAISPALSHSIVALAALSVFAAAALGLGRRRCSPASSTLNRPWPLECKRALLSEPELALYRRLVQAAPEHLVLSQVHLLQMVHLKPGARRALKNHFSQLSVDFVVLEPDTRIVAAVELDDASHSRDHRRRADARKTHALSSAGIPLLRWNVRELPSVGAIQAALAGARALRIGRSADPRMPGAAPRAYS
jgi:hypothetical protein